MCNNNSSSLRIVFGICITLFGLMMRIANKSEAVDYAYQTVEPQKQGWPLTAQEQEYILKPEFQRRPGSEKNKYLPNLWPIVPSAGFWEGRKWLDAHAQLVNHVQANTGSVDILLVGDSITQQWNSPLDVGKFNTAWQKHFGHYKTINLGIGGDKTQNILWRLDHGGLESIDPRLVILLIGNNNMFFTPETGVDPVANGIQMCVVNLREKFPKADVILVTIFPAHAPGNRFYEDIKQTNIVLDKLHLEIDPKVQVLDLTSDLINLDGALKPALFLKDKIHLDQNAGYALYARKLKPLVEKSLRVKPAANDNKTISKQ